VALLAVGACDRPWVLMAGMRSVTRRGPRWLLKSTHDLPPR
jgi:hypothetical protein